MKTLLYVTAALSVVTSIIAFTVLREAPPVTFLGHAAPFIFYGGAIICGLTVAVLLLSPSPQDRKP